MVDETKLNQFIGQILGDLGGAFGVPLVRIGDLPAQEFRQVAARQRLDDRRSSSAPAFRSHIPPTTRRRRPMSGRWKHPEGRLAIRARPG
jgi:hypothetical protein